MLHQRSHPSVTLPFYAKVVPTSIPDLVLSITKHDNSKSQPVSSEYNFWNHLYVCGINHFFIALFFWVKIIVTISIIKGTMYLSYIWKNNINQLFGLGSSFLASFVTTSITMENSKGLCTEPWWSSTFTSKLLLYEASVLTMVLAQLYKSITACTSQSYTPDFLMAYLITSLGSLSNAFTRSTKVR